MCPVRPGAPSCGPSMDLQGPLRRGVDSLQGSRVCTRDRVGTCLTFRGTRPGLTSPRAIPSSPGGSGTFLERGKAVLGHGPDTQPGGEPARGAVAGG